LLPAELEEPEDPAAVSECRLKLADEQGLAPLKGLILVDLSVASSLRREARDVIVWGNRCLSDLLDSPLALAEVQRQAAEIGWLIITASDLFSPRLVRLRKNPRIEGHATDMRDMLEPVRPLVLLLDQSGTRGLEADRGDRRTSVTLHTKLEQGSRSAAHSITITYRVDDPSSPQLVTDVEWDFGQTSVWPNFASQQWTHYFARLTYPTTREQIRPQFAMSRNIIAAAISSSNTPQHAVQTARAINEGQAPAEKETWFRRFQNVSGKAYEELQSSDRPFEVVFYVDYHPDRGDAAAGCVRLKLLEPAQRDNRVSVAIDFGSTNTVACLSGANGKPLSFQGRVVHPIKFQDASRNDEWEHIVRWNYVDFLPLAERRTPTPTVVIRRNDADRNADLWLYRHLIYFQPVGNHAKEGAAAEISKLESYLKRSEFNLKWNEDSEHVEASADFLEQFMTMVAAEAAASEYNPNLIDWHFSVPDAMYGTRRITSFKSQIETARKRLSPQGKLNELYSEGLAAARYILSGREGSKFTQGSINAILDIGGSTTDITLWANDRLIWKNSFRLAGRAFFTETIVHNPDLLREVELEDWADLIDPDHLERVPQENVADVGELLFSRPALEEAFDKHWNKRINLKAGEALRSTSLVFLSGIAHYLGLVAHKLVEDGIVSNEDLARPAFALCGRGAGIFRRMHEDGPADAESPVTNALKTFSEAARTSKATRPQLFISRQPKLEVAAGMMVNFDAIDARVGNGNPISTFAPAALSVEFSDGSRISPEEAVDAVQATGGTRGSDLASIIDFLETFEKLTGVAVNLKKGVGQGAFNEISTIVRQKVDAQRDEAGRLLLSEPPFITALSGLVSIMASPKAERDARMLVGYAE